MHATIVKAGVVYVNALSRASRRLAAMAGLLTALLAVCWGSSASATAYSWNNGAGGSWTTLTNWTPNADPNSASDTVSFANIGGPYIATLSAPRTIGGLNISGSDPTLTLSSTLTLSGGTSAISGGTINGAGTLRLTNTPLINWTGGALGGTAVILLPTLNNASINNTAGTFSLGSGQSIRLGDVANPTATPTVLTFANGFSNDGEIRLGINPPGDNYGIFRLAVTSGTLTNNAGGNINLVARTAANSGPPWNTREILANLQNNGTITVTASDGILGGTGLTVTNTGTIKTDHSIYTAGNEPRLTINGTSFTNTGNLQVGANHGGLGGGRMLLRSTTTDLNSGTNITGPGVLEMGGTTVNVNAGTTISGLTMIAMGQQRPNFATPNPTTINWNIADLTDPMTWRINANAEVTMVRTGAWNLPSNQVLDFYAPDPLGNNNNTSLTMAQDFNNSGLVRMGRVAPGDNYVNAQLILTGTKTFTNNASGVVDMLPRSSTSDQSPWYNRYINANVINNGTINAYSGGGRLGDTGKTVVNNATINASSSLLSGSLKAEIQMTGTSYTNNVGGTINLTNASVWFNTPTVNYDGGSITGNSGSIIRLGNITTDTNFIYNGGAEITSPVTWFVVGQSENTITRSSTWNLPTGGTVFFDAPADPGLTGLKVTQDVSNSGLVQMGRPSPGDNYANQYFQVNSTNSVFTNNATGVITMYPRNNAAFTDPYSIRKLEAELINNGQLTSYTHRASVGKAIAGIDHVNNGTITLNNSILTGTPRPQIDFLGATLTNGATGVINGNGIINVVTLNGTADVLQNAGTLSPGLSAGLLTVQGNVNMLSGGKLYIEVTGSGAVAGVDYDQLTVTGNVTNITQADLVVNVSSTTLDLTGDLLTILTGSTTNFTGQQFNSVTFTGNGFFKGDVIYGNGFIRLANIESFVPEPGTGCLLLLGLVALRRRQRQAVAV